jgi:uncharacterized protein (DUF1499 family)
MKTKLSAVLGSLMVLSGCSGKVPDLGIRNGELTPCPQSPNCVNSQAADEKHAIPPLRFMGTSEEAQARLLKIIQAEKRTQIIDARADYICATFTSALFRFVDDVEFYLPEQQGDEMLIHVRSASRVGYSDLGVNRKRVERIRSQLSANPE